MKEETKQQRIARENILKEFPNINEEELMKDTVSKKKTKKQNKKDESVKPEVEYVETEKIEDNNFVVDHAVSDVIQKIAEKTYNDIQAKDYRATVVHREESGQVPDAVTTFVQIDESKLDEMGSPIELDIKGTISPFEADLFKDVNYAMALAKLKDWAFLEVEVEDYNGNIVTKRVPCNLAQIDMLSKKRLNMSVAGSQSIKHIRALFAGAGINPFDSVESKAAGFFGWKRERINKEQLNNQYGEKE